MPIESTNLLEYFEASQIGEHVVEYDEVRPFSLERVSRPVEPSAAVMRNKPFSAKKLSRSGESAGRHQWRQFAAFDEPRLPRS